MEGAGTRQIERWDASTPADVGDQLHRISVVSDTLQGSTVIYLLLAPDGSKGGFNKSLSQGGSFLSLLEGLNTKSIGNTSTESTLKQRVFCDLESQFAASWKFSLLWWKEQQDNEEAFLKRDEKQVSACVIQEKSKKVLCLQERLRDSLSATSLPMHNPQLLLSDLLVWNSVTFGILPKYFVPLKTVLSWDAIHRLWGCDSGIFAQGTLRFHSEQDKQSLLQFSSLNMAKQS